MDLDASGKHVLIEDQVLREGLQMESRIFSLGEKLQLFQVLKRAGLKRIQVGSFVMGAAGNIPTEDAVHLFEAMGVATGMDIEVLCQAVTFLEETLTRRLPGRMQRVLEHRRRGE